MQINSRLFGSFDSFRYLMDVVVRLQLGCVTIEFR